MNAAPRRALLNGTLFLILTGGVLVINIDQLATDPPAWLLVAVASSALAVVVIDLLLWMNRRHGGRLSPFQAASEEFVIGIVYGTAQVGFATALGLETQRGAILTIVSVTITMIALGVLYLLIVQAWRDESSRLQRLALEEADLEAARAEASEIVRGMQLVLASDIDTALSPTRVALETRLGHQARALAPEDWPGVAEELRAAAVMTVRPLSRRLWISYADPVSRPSLGRILRTIVTQQPLQPVVLILIYWAASVGGTIALLGWGRGLLMMTLGTGLIAGVLGGANFLMQRWPSHHAAIFILATIVLQMTGLLTFVVRQQWSSVPYTWVEYVIASLGGVILIVVTSGFGSVRSHQQTMAELFRSAIDDDLRATLAASRQIAQLARESARILHGTIQTRLIACAVAIERASMTEDVAAYNTAMHEAHSALMPVTWRTPPEGTLREQVERATELWSGLCAVEVSVDPRLAEMNGMVGRDASRIVEEGMNNAITHGEATTIAVNVQPCDGGILIEVHDDGSGPTGDAPGLGSALFDSLCQDWKLEARGTGSTLRAVMSTG